MGVDGLCTDYPGRVDEANKKFRPQASQTDAATFPFPQGPDASSGVDLRGLAADRDITTTPTTTASTRALYGNSSSAQRRINPPTRKAEGSTDATALGGWYSRCGTCEHSSEGGSDDQQRLIAALYGDLAGVRDFAVGTVEDAKILVKVCSRAAAVRSFLVGDAMKGKAASRELEAATQLCKEAEAEAEQTLRPFVSSAETFEWSVNLISTEKVREREGSRQGLFCIDKENGSGRYGSGLNYSTLIPSNSIIGSSRVDPLLPVRV